MFSNSPDGKGKVKQQQNAGRDGLNKGYSKGDTKGNSKGDAFQGERKAAAKGIFFFCVGNEKSHLHNCIIAYLHVCPSVSSVPGSFVLDRRYVATFPLLKKSTRSTDQWPQSFPPPTPMECKFAYFAALPNNLQHLPRLGSVSFFVWFRSARDAIECDETRNNQ